MRSDDPSLSDFPQIPWTLLRLNCGFFGLLSSSFALLALRNQLQHDFNLLGVILTIASSTAAAMCWWFAFRGQFADSRKRMTFSLVGGVILGGISFAPGFIGPMIFLPGDNLGPLIGIFFTGPIGFVLGVALGTIIGFFAINRNRVDESCELRKCP